VDKCNTKVKLSFSTSGRRIIKVFSMKQREQAGRLTGPGDNTNGNQSAKIN